MRSFDVLVTPKAVFEDLKLRPRWVEPFLVVVLAMVFISWFKACLLVGSVVFDISRLIVTGLGASVAIMFIWLFVATLIYAASNLLMNGVKLQYRTSWSLASHTSIIFLFGEILNVLLVRLPFVSSISFPLPNRFPLGLDVFLWGTESNLQLAVLLHSINPIIVWCLVTFSCGISIVGEISRGRAFLLASTVWLFGVALIELLVYTVGGTTFRIDLM
jgi:hypothetical protein